METIKKILETKAKVADLIIGKPYLLNPVLNDEYLDRFMEKRSKEIFLARLEGNTFKEIGKQHKISIERARDIFWKSAEKLGTTQEYIATLEQKILELKKDNKTLKKQLQKEPDIDIPKSLYYMKIEKLMFSSRINNCFRGAGIIYVCDIIDILDDGRIKSISGIGIKSYYEVKKKLLEKGIKLPEYY